MKQCTIIGFIIAVLTLLGLWIWSHSRHEEQSAYQGTTQLVLSGTTGVVFTGYYIQDGQRIAVSNALPWNCEGERISSFEIRKLNPDDTLVVNMRYDGNGAHAKLTKPLGAGVPGARVRVQNGLISETLVRGE